MEQSYPIDSQKLTDAQQAFDISVLNGIVCLVIAMKKRGLLTKEEIEGVHETMTKPFVLPRNADNRAVQDAQRLIDELFAVLIEPPS